MRWSGRRVLVTGGDGFIGSHLVEGLVRDGARVRALVYYNSFGSCGWLDSLDPAVRESVEVVPGDVRDGFLVDEAVRGCDDVFHLAALIGIPYSYRAAESYIQTNVTGTLNIAEACRRHGTQLIHTSTSEVYGSAVRVPMDEQHPLVPQSPYAASKLGGDALALSYWYSHELPVTVVRPFNTYGPRQSSRAVIPTILAQLLAGAETVRLGATSPVRDFNYVTDTVEGFLLLGQCDAARGLVTNIGSGREISIGQLFEVACCVIGRSAQLVTDEDRLRPEASEVDRLVCDYSAAATLSGYSPKVALEQGLGRTAEWVERNLDSFDVDGYQV